MCPTFCGTIFSYNKFVVPVLHVFVLVTFYFVRWDQITRTDEFGSYRQITVCAQGSDACYLNK